MKSEPSTVSSLSPQLPLRPKASTPPLIAALTETNNLQRRRFHVPAHAGFRLLPAEWDLVQDPYRYDLTELDGLDVLSEPSGSIAETQARMAEMFGVAHSFMLVNGASVGLAAAMLACVRPGDKVLLPRNVHRSVLSGLILSGAEPVWFLPERLSGWGLWGGVSPAEVERLLAEHPDVKALFVTSPTYEGIGSDIRSLAMLCRARDVRLVVDEAHGSLWPFSLALPESAVSQGADAVIHSLHKSGGSLTQSALAHLPNGSRIDPAVFQQALNTLQTTSPSYLLMASLDATCHYLHSEAGQDRIDWLLKQIGTLREQLGVSLNRFELLTLANQPWDPGKLYFRLPGASGEEWAARIEETRCIAYESASPQGVLYLANLGLQTADFEALAEAFIQEEAALSARAEAVVDVTAGTATMDEAVLTPQMAMRPREAFFAPGERVPVGQAVGRTAKETVVHCPPGIPVLMPGERIQAGHAPYLPEDGVLVVR